MQTNLKYDDSHSHEIWKAVYRALEADNSITPQQLQLWIEPLRLVEIQPKEKNLFVRIAAQRDFSAQWVRDNFQAHLESAFNHVLGKETSIQIEVLHGERLASTMEPHSEILMDPESKHSLSSFENHASPQSPQKTQASPPPREPHSVSSHPGHRPASIPQISSFDSRYTFETFVIGASNQFAHAASYAVAQNPATQYNPLFLYSAPGLGKTHLLHAIANHVLEKNPNFRVLYISAERFMNEMIESIQHKKTEEFRRKYRDYYDVLLFDDIQFIAGKTQTQEEFFHTFNALHSAKRQIVLTSDRPPKEIQGLEERLRTRFEWGLIADITPPEIETRIAILKAKAERDDIYLPDDVATFLATYIKSNVRELEGVLIKLQAHASLTGAELSIDLAKQQLKLVIPEQGSTFTVDSIQAAVAKHFQIKSSDFKSKSKQQSVARPRQIAMYLIRKYTHLGFKEIGDFFGGRDHTTIMHACREIEKKIELDPETKEAVEAIQNLL